MTAEFYNCAVEVMRGAEAIDEYIALPQQEAFDIEYWLLEEAKLQRMPAEKELARQIHVVIGAGSGIGKETAHRLVKEGAHIVCVDLNAEAAQATAREIEAKYGVGIGVAGTGLSGCGPAIGLGGGNITDRASIRAMLDQVALAYGGFDAIEVTAGILVRELAVELAPLVRVKGVAPATVVQGKRDVPARPGDRFTGEVQPAVYRRRGDGIVGEEAGAVLRRPHADQVAYHPGGPSRGLFRVGKQPAKQVDRPDHHGGRRFARGVPALGRARPIP